MTNIVFQRATKKTVAPNVAFMGTSGSGKTFSALLFARGLVGPQGRIAFIDTENRSAQLYANVTPFDACDIKPVERQFGENVVKEFWWEDFRDAINAAVAAEYDALVIDSFSHIWEGVLSWKARKDLRKGSNSFTNWNETGAAYKTIFDLINQAPIPVICCFRTKTAYAIETNDRNQAVPKKIGTEPVARDGAEYEFTVAFDLDAAHVATASKDRTGIYREPKTIDEKSGELLRDWLAETPRIEPEPVVENRETYNEYETEVQY